MSRPLRIQYPDAIYHVCARGNERRRVFWRDKDHEHFCELIGETCDRFFIRVFAFALMPNHFHLMLQTPLANLSAAMHWLKTSYTVWLNRSRQRVGHLFQGRYHSVIVEDEGHYLELSRYIHLNPVRARIVERPEKYQWSSCLDYVKQKKRWSWIDREDVLNELGGKGRNRHRKYSEFLYAGVGLDDAELKRFRLGHVLGGDEFREWLGKKFGEGNQGEIKGLSEIAGYVRPSCKEAADLLVKELKRHLPQRSTHRGTVMFLLHQLGYALRDIGKIYGLGYSAVSQNARRFSAEKNDAKVFERVMSNVKR